MGIVCVKGAQLCFAVRTHYGMITTVNLITPHLTGTTFLANVKCPTVLLHLLYTVTLVTVLYIAFPEHFHFA